MKKDNLINKKFGKLLIIREDGVTDAGHLKWLCVCECGKEVSRTGTSLKRSKNSSCGCFKLYGKKSPLWKGYGDISAAWFYNVIHRAASGRKNRNSIIKKIDIDIIYIWNLFLKQDKKCALSNLDLTFPIKETNIEYKKATASLDRIDNSKGYIKGNLQWVHKDINRMKNIYSNDYFINICKLITNNKNK